jgi:ABC-type Fe3+ transport system substrate-binding protein
MDLLDKRFSAPGTIVIADPRATQSGMSFFWTMVTRLGADYYKKLMEQQPAIGPGAGPVAQLVGSGAHAIGIGTFSNHVQGTKAEGAPIGYVYPPEVATGSDNQIAISAQAPHPNAARLYAAYRISRASHEVLCKVGGSASPLGEIEGCEPPAPADYIQTNYEIWKDHTWQEQHLPLLGLAPRT